MPSQLPTTIPALDREIVEEVVIDWRLKAALRVRRRRSALGLSQAQMANECGISPQGFGMIERGVVLPAEPVRWIIAYVLGCDTEDLWEPMPRVELQRRCANLIEVAA